MGTSLDMANNLAQIYGLLQTYMYGDTNTFNPNFGGELPPGLSTNDIVELTLVLGDDSGSGTEVYEMVLEGSRANRFFSKKPVPNVPKSGMATNTFKVLKGETYTLSIRHINSTHEDGPDYDYVAEVLYPTNAPVILDDPDGILGAHGQSGIQDPVFFAEGKTATIHIININIASVDATDDGGFAKINYHMTPSNASIHSVTFTAPGMTETRSLGISGDFFFTYSQSDLPYNQSDIILSYLNNESVLHVNKELINTELAEEIVFATIPVDPGWVHLPILHKLREEYARITYSGVTVLPEGYLIHIGKSHATLQSDPTVTIDWASENHRYHDDDGTYDDHGMTLFTGQALPPTSNYRKYYDSTTDNRFFIPGNNLKGIAQVDVIQLDGVYPLNLANENVDRGME